MTQTISPYYNPYDSPYFDSLPIFSLFPITMTFCSSKRSVMLLHQGMQILSALCLKCNSYRHLYRFFPSLPLGLLNYLFSQRFSLDFSLLFALYTDLIITQQIISLLTLFIVFFSKLEYKTHEDREF